MDWKCFKPIFEYDRDYGNLDSAWIGHRYFAYDLIRNTNPKTIVELGTHKGGSFFSFCQAVKDANLPTALYAIDTWKGDKHSGKYDESVFKLVNKLSKQLYPEVNISLIRKTFNQALKEFSNNSIDILHIDGLHTYEAVKEDFDNWLPKVKQNGIILLHDVFEKKEDFGVYKLWNELKKKYSYFEFINYHGLGLVFKDKQFFNFNTIYQDYYQILDNLDNTKQDLDNTKHELDSTKQELDNTKQELDSAKQKLDNTKQDLKRTIKTVEKNSLLKNQIQNTNLEIQKLESDLNKIKSAKFFKLWQGYNKLKKLI